ncbi:MAG: DNA-binding protein WhiA [Erysipelotrichaceae bacterium]|nr:DNA-binding protein WhiA [Erysipelotrichaceae bacterium]
MSFASLVKDEIALTVCEYEKDQLSAILKTSGNIFISNGKKSVSFKTENAKIAQMVYKNIYTLYNIKPTTSIYRSMKLKKNNVYCILINKKVNEILDDLDILQLNILKNIVRSEKRMKAFLSGCFLAGGSVNTPKKTNYHLEFTSWDESFAKEILRILEKMNYSAKMIKRRNQYVVYVKKAQEIADLLVAMGAAKSYLDFEDYRISRDFYNSDNRIANCDIANAIRTNMAANQQINDIKLLQKYVDLRTLDDDLRILANLRLSNPEDSLRELAEKYNEITKKSITKSGINHLFIKLKNISSQYQQKDVK